MPDKRVGEKRGPDNHCHCRAKAILEEVGSVTSHLRAVAACPETASRSLLKDMHTVASHLSNAVACPETVSHLSAEEFLSLCHELQRAAEEALQSLKRIWARNNSAHARTER